MRCGQLPSNCTLTGVPQGVLPPSSSLEQTRRKVLGGSDDPETRTN
jgi:hypothetical protein